MSGRPILVTGAHRSGTTWIGRMLALAPGVGYIHEPFNPATLRGLSSAPFDHYYTRITTENRGVYEPGLTRTLAFRYAYGRQLATLRTPRDAGRAARDAAGFLRARRTNARPLVKDPIALVSADWLAARFDMDVVVTIRHPAGFAASVLRLGWRHDVSTFRDDPRLAAFRPELDQPHDPLEHAALLWRVLYTLVDGYRQEQPDWLFVRHEDASLAPLDTFERLYAALGLELTEHARCGIAETSSSRNPTVAVSKHAIAVDSAANAVRWRADLPPADVDRLRELTADVWPRFYSDDDW